MKRACIAITKQGCELAKRIPGADLYLQEKFCTPEAKPFIKVGDVVKRLFSSYETMIFICATGIAVRSIAPLLKDKQTDPAVLVIDQEGKYCVSLLSGHVGGANQEAEEIATAIGAQPVITTASDVAGSFAIDLFAKEHAMKIEHTSDLTGVTADIVNGETVVLVDVFENDIPLPENIIRTNDKVDGAKSVLYITPYVFTGTLLPYVTLRPKCIIVGIGCRKGIDEAIIETTVTEALRESHVSFECVKRVATIDIKGEEKGILRFCQKRNLPLSVIPSEKVKECENEYQQSEFVKENVGVGCVCEPCAVLGGNDAKLISCKYAKGGVTVALALERLF